MSDVELVRQSGILDMFEKGDKVLADKGFSNVSDFLIREVELVTPEFKHKDDQFSLSQNIYNADVSNARIHVERAIGRWKNFKITRGPIPLTMVDLVDNIFTVVGGLVNMMGVLVPVQKEWYSCKKMLFYCIVQRTQSKVLMFGCDIFKEWEINVVLLILLFWHLLSIKLANETQFALSEWLAKTYGIITVKTVPNHEQLYFHISRVS